MKTTVIIKNINQAFEIKDLVQSFIVPLKDYSINYVDTFSLDDVKVLKETGREIFVCINKNFYNNELDDLKSLMINIDKLDIAGIIFYDIAVVKIKNDLNLKTDLVWSQEHLVTNYGTINYWYDKGATYAYLSSELSKDEILDIIRNSKSKLFMNVFGYVPMFTSRRHLVNNYLDYFNLLDKSSLKKIYKEGKEYPIVDDVHGTTVYSDYVLNILDEDFFSDMHIVFNSIFISDEDFKSVLVGFRDNRFPYEHGFLYKETVYRVKKND